MNSEVESTGKQSIKSWSEDDRPREKMLNKGRQTLSNVELIAILLGSGSRKESAVDLSRRLLRDFDNDLNKLARLNVGDLRQYKGIGVAKAVTLLAAIELSTRRKSMETVVENIKTSDQAYDVIRSVLVDLSHEEFWVIALNRNHRVIGKYLVSRGGVSGTVADIKLIFKPAIQSLASAIIVCHNHPSGSLKPSKADKRLTDKVKRAGGILDIDVLDHLIVADNNYYSFADEGQI